MGSWATVYRLEGDRLMVTSERKLKHRIESMRKFLRGKLLLGEMMSRHTTFGIGGPAEAFFTPEDTDDLVCCLRLCNERNIPFMAIGNGSNLLFRDGGFRGLVISTGLLTEVSITKDKAQGDDIEVVAQSGILMSRLLNFCVSHSLTGLEFATGIPGTVGGAVKMNAGAYGSCLGDVLSWVDLVEDDGTRSRIPRERIHHGYRSLRMPKKGLIIAAAFHLLKAEERIILDKIKNILSQRGEKLPFGWRNAGSVFKNPEGQHAGRIIEELGFKGQRAGDAMVSEQHANVIVNVGEAKARDVINLMEEINRECREKKGLTLEAEIIIVGEG